MREISARDALLILERRMERRAAVLKEVNLPAYDMAIIELRNFAAMTRKAITYLDGKREPPRPPC